MDSQIVAIIALAIYILVGVVFCFFGNKWLKVVLAIYGFIAGFLLAYTLLPMFTSLDSAYMILISLGAGVVGALLFVLLMYAGIFFIGFGAGVVLSLLIIDAFNLNLYLWYVYIPVIIIGCILGSITLNNRRIFVSIFSSYIGASMLAVALYAIVNGINSDNLMLTSRFQDAAGLYTSWLYIITLAVSFVAGLVIQLTITSKKKNS